MKIVNICGFDNANFSHDNANALRSVGVDCEDYILQKHPFNYASQSTLINRGQVWEVCKDADIIQIMHSDIRLVNLCQRLKEKKCVVWHTGSIYRQGYVGINNFFNEFVLASFNALGEFDGLGAKNPYYFVGSIDTDKLQPVYNKGKRIAHHPSNPTVKGTDNIIRMVNDLDLNLTYSKDIVNYDVQIERMKQCDIYIELFNLTLGGKKYGSWGITALESACLGKATITNHSTLSVYNRTYGDIGITIANNEFEFKNKLLELYHGDTNYYGKVSREWVVMNHSYKASGKRLINILSGL